MVYPVVSVLHTVLVRQPVEIRCLYTIYLLQHGEATRFYNFILRYKFARQNVWDVTKLAFIRCIR